MPGPLDALEARFRDATTPDVPAFAWGVWQAGESWQGAVGATARTPFSVASVTKPMTATAVMRLVERGLVDLDAPISDYLEVPLDGDVRGATVRRTLDHTAGLPLHYHFFYADEPFAPPPFAETIRRYGKTFWKPGRYLYSNLGYGLLDHLIERVSGLSYARFMDEEVFRPLGMAHTSIGPVEGAAVPHGKGFAYPFYTFDHPGASAAFASVEDLLAFGRFHLEAPPLDGATHEPSAEAGPGRGYGLGWGIDARGFVEHSGGMGGVRSLLRLVPSLDLVIALVANGETDLLSGVADEIIATLAPDFPLDGGDRSRPAEDLPPSVIGTWRAQIETYQGEVSLDFNVGDEFETRGGRVFGVVDGDVGTEDAARRPYRLHLDLEHVGGELRGAATAVSVARPGERMGNALSYRLIAVR